jgi:hypothetical protein
MINKSGIDYRGLSHNPASVLSEVIRALVCTKVSRTSFQKGQPPVQHLMKRKYDTLQFHRIERRIIPSHKTGSSGILVLTRRQKKSLFINGIVGNDSRGTRELYLKINSEANVDIEVGASRVMSGFAKPANRFLRVILLVLMSLSFASVQATFTMGILKYVSRDYAAAYDEFKPLADQGDRSAQYYMGQMYRNGQGVEQNFKEAFKWYRLAAEQGEVRSQHIVAQLYHRGVGVIQNHREAVKWYELAANQGQVGPQTDLAFMYRDDNVIRDHKEAIRWFKVLAEQDHAFAHYNLGLMYQKGQGVSPDNLQAHMWFNIAAADGHESARIERDEIAKQMLPADISRAQDMARECVEKNYRGC